MILIKKWENKSIYKTGRGSVVAKNVDGYAVVETEDQLLIRALEIVHKFSEKTVSKAKAHNPKEVSVKMTKELPSQEEQLEKVKSKSLSKTKKSKSKK